VFQFELFIKLRKKIGNLKYFFAIFVKYELATMSNKTILINSIEEKLRKLLLSYESLKQQNEGLKQQIQVQASKQLKMTNQINDLEDQLLSAKIANSILGSNDGAKETKSKINLLIREIDKCISTLNE